MPWSPSRLPVWVVPLGCATVDVVVFSRALVEPRMAPVYLLTVGAVAGLLLLRRRHPVPVWVTVVLGTAAVGVFVRGCVPTACPVAATVAAVAALPQRRSLLPTVAVAGLLAATGTISEARSPESAAVALRDLVISQLLFLAVIHLTAWAITVYANRAERRLREAEALRQKAIQDERARIARELHDIVSHSVSVMVLQAAGARRVLERDPARAGQALETIEGVGKESMGELRRLLGVLRDGGISTEEIAELGPQPGLADVPALVDRMSRAGLRVRLEVEGTARRVDRSVDLSAYRIVQEALTNTTKHAGTAQVVVRLRWRDEGLVVEVVDDGTVPVTDPQLSLGQGLVGMVERARAVGGQLEAAPVPGGGFRVVATLPVSDEPRSTGGTGPAGARGPGDRSGEAVG